MRKIAIGTPNPVYGHYTNLKDINIEARIVNKALIYVEVGLTYETKVKPETIKALFAIDRRRKSDRPFLISQNRDLWIVLNRKRKKYIPKFKELLRKNKQNKSAFKRTKFRRTK